MVRRMSEWFGKRVEREAGPDPQRQVEQAYWIALSRPPSAEEKDLALTALAELRRIEPAQLSALSELCHTILNTAAFMYID